MIHLLLLLLALGGARADTAGGDPALLAERFLQQAADLGLWSGTAACSGDAGPDAEMWQVENPAACRRRLQPGATRIMHWREQLARCSAYCTLMGWVWLARCIAGALAAQLPRSLTHSVPAAQTPRAPCRVGTGGPAVKWALPCVRSSAFLWDQTPS